MLKTDAIVVYGMRWSDTSKIVHLFTKDKGYVKVIAKGALRPKSPFRGILENLNRTEVILSLRESRGLQNLTQAYLLNPYSNLRENLQGTAVAYSILELIKSLVHYNEAAQSLFQFTVSILEALNQPHPGPPMFYLYRFILYLSDYLGFGWDLSECRLCRRLPGKFPVNVDVLNGAVVCEKCVTPVFQKSYQLTEGQWRLLNQLQNTRPENLSQSFTDFSGDKNRLTILDMLLDHLNYHTEQSLQLKSLKMYLP